MRKAFVLTASFFLLSFFSCKDDKDTQVPSVVILNPVENSEYEVLGQVFVKANVYDNEVVESVQVSLISDDSRNKVLPSVDLKVGQKDYLLEYTFEISDSLLSTGRYYLQIEAFDGENRTSSFRYINIRGMNKEQMGVFVTCSDDLTADLYFDQNQFVFQRIHQFGKQYQGAIFNRFNQEFWFLPKNNNEIEMYDPVKGSATFSKVFNSNFPNSFGTIKKDNRDVRFTVADIGVKGFNQNQNENYTYLTPATKKVESLGVGELANVVEEVDRNGGNRFLIVLNKSTGASLRARNIFSDVVDIQFIDDESALVFCNTAQGGKGMLFNINTTALQTNLFSCDSIREVIKTNVGDFVISTKSTIQIYRPTGNGNLVNYLTIRDAVLAYDDLNNQVYVGFGTQLRVYNYRQISAVRSISMPNKIVGINVKFNQF
ncbi:hypothetical protein N9515_09490 [Vicingaceae bacterium]|nr:hypothetical protein [Vicingaceae bacterium]